MQAASGRTDSPLGRYPSLPKAGVRCSGYQLLIEQPEKGETWRVICECDLRVVKNIQVIDGALNAVHTEYWIPGEGLAEFNGKIVGVIEVTAEFRGLECD